MAIGGLNSSRRFVVTLVGVARVRVTAGRARVAIMGPGNLIFRSFVHCFCHFLFGLAGVCLAFVLFSQLVGMIVGGNRFVLFRVIILLALPFAVGSTVAQDSLLRLDAPENTAPLNPNWLRWSPDVIEEVSRKSLDQPLRLPQTQLSGQAKRNGQAHSVSPNQSGGLAQRDNLAVERALATSMELQRYPVQPIPSHYDDDSQSGRMVRQ
jgi:hypothetical protein